MADDMWFWIYLSLLPCYQRPVKGKRWGFDPLDCFSTPALLFFTKPRFWFGSTFCFQDLQKTILRCVSSPCVRKNGFPFEARHFVWNLLTCRKLQNDFGNDPTNVMLFLLPLLWKHSCYLCFFKETTGCVGKKSVQLQIHVGVFESGDLHGFPTNTAIN